MSMVEAGKRRSEASREKLLAAAEAVFAENGFDGARIDVIAEHAGLNKTLIFRYFGDKVGLYMAVIRRADRDSAALQERLLRPFLDETLVADGRKVRALFIEALRSVFEFLREHPLLMRILVWEHAEGWQTLAQSFSLPDLEDLVRIRNALAEIQRAGWLRTDIDPLLLLIIIEQLFWSYLTSLPFYQMLSAGQDLFSAEALVQAREALIEMIVGGILVDQEDTRADH
jgi:AcrR family transcriptional regulator